MNKGEIMVELLKMYAHKCVNWHREAIRLETTGESDIIRNLAMCIDGERGSADRVSQMELDHHLSKMLSVSQLFDHKMHTSDVFGDVGDWKKYLSKGDYIVAGAMIVSQLISERFVMDCAEDNDD